MNALTKFLKNNYNQSKEKNSYTHLKLDKPGGSYAIDEKDTNDFFDLYTQVLKSKDYNMLALTEGQKKVGPLLIDLDFKFSTRHNTRQYRESNIKQFIEAINEIATRYFDVKKKTLRSYVFEKKHIAEITKLRDHTDEEEADEEYVTGYKDGLHIMYPFFPLEREFRHFIRLKLMEILKDDNSKILKGIPFTNTIDDVFDASVMSTNAWLLYGSRKQPTINIKSQAYELTHIYRYDGKVCSDRPDDDILPQFFSIRTYNDDDSIPVKDIQHISKDIQQIKIDNNLISKAEIKSLAKLNRKINKAEIKKKQDMDDMEFDFKDTDQRCIQATTLVKLLGVKESDNYELWRDICWALKNTSRKLKKTFIDFSRLSSKFDEEKSEEMWENSKIGFDCYSITKLKNIVRNNNSKGYNKYLSQLEFLKINPTLPADEFCIDQALDILRNANDNNADKTCVDYMLTYLYKTIDNMYYALEYGVLREIKGGKLELADIYLCNLPDKIRKRFRTEQRAIRTCSSVNDPLLHNGKLNLSMRFMHEYKRYKTFSKKTRAKVEIFLDYIANIFCEGKRDAHFKYITQWLAYLCTGQKNKSCLYLRSIEGTGKSTLSEFISKYVIGMDLWTKGRAKNLLNFGGIFMGKLLVTFEEMVSTQCSDWQGAGEEMKTFITEDLYNYNEKNKREISCNNISSVIINTNKDAIKDDAGRRFYLPNISTKYINDKKYWYYLYSKIMNKTVGHAVFCYLLELDISDYRCNDYPMTNTKQMKIIDQMGCVARFIKNEYVLKSKPLICQYHDLFEHFKSKYPESIRITLRIFGSKLADSQIRFSKSNGKSYFNISAQELNEIAKKNFWMDDFDVLDDGNNSDDGVDYKDALLNELQQTIDKKDKQIYDLKIKLQSKNLKDEDEEDEDEDEDDDTEDNDTDNDTDNDSDDSDSDDSDSENDDNNNDDDNYEMFNHFNPGKLFR